MRTCSLGMLVAFPVLLLRGDEFSYNSSSRHAGLFCTSVCCHGDDIGLSDKETLLIVDSTSTFFLIHPVINYGIYTGKIAAEGIWGLKVWEKTPAVAELDQT